MASETQSGGTFANDTTVGNVDWIDLSNVATSDNNDALAFMINDITHYLKATNFGFGLPSGVVDGIEAKIEREKSAGGGGMKDNSLRLFKGGTIQGDDKADLATEWTTDDLIITYGSPTDKWGLTWTIADINASNFGLGFSAINPDASTAFIDHIQLIVYYTPDSKTMMFT